MWVSSNVLNQMGERDDVAVCIDLATNRRRLSMDVVLRANAITRSRGLFRGFGQRSYPLVTHQKTGETVTTSG